MAKKKSTQKKQAKNRKKAKGSVVVQEKYRWMLFGAAAGVAVCLYFIFL